MGICFVLVVFFLVWLGYLLELAPWVNRIHIAGGRSGLSPNPQGKDRDLKVSKYSKSAESTYMGYAGRNQVKTCLLLNSHRRFLLAASYKHHSSSSKSIRKSVKFSESSIASSSVIGPSFFGFSCKRGKLEQKQFLCLIYIMGETIETNEQIIS